MHVRFSTCRHTPVLEERNGDLLGTVENILLNPDTGVVEGFYLDAPGMFGGGAGLFLCARDVRRFGKRIDVRDHHVIAPVEDTVRLQSLVQDGRRMLGQRMRTEQGRQLGVCKDVQFDTITFQVQWLFPRRFFRWGIPVSAHNIIEVTQDAIIIRDQTVTVKAKEEQKNPADIVAAPTVA